VQEPLEPVAVDVVLELGEQAADERAEEDELGLERGEHREQDALQGAELVRERDRRRLEVVLRARARQPSARHALRPRTWRWYRKVECRRESVLPNVSKRMTVSALTSARKCRMFTSTASLRTRIVGTRFGIRESIFRRSRGCARAWSAGDARPVETVPARTLSRCSEHRFDFLNWPEIVFTLPARRCEWGFTRRSGEGAMQKGKDVWRESAAMSDM
jgi:hypothetical protein